MAFITADVIPSDDEDQPFKVVFMRGDEILVEWLVETQEEGEEQLLEAVRELGEDGDRDEDEDDDDEDDEDEDGDEEEEDDDDKPKKKK